MPNSEIARMAYDEHYSGSDAGSVASLGFVNQGVADTLQEVPADQLILGIPFYTRLWKLTPTDSEEEPYEVSSEALGMSEAESRVAANGATFQWLEDCGQYYAEYEYEGSTYQVWLEDQNSIQKKLEVMEANGLAEPPSGNWGMRRILSGIRLQPSWTECGCSFRRRDGSQT